jgi:hypothetical protein
MQEINAAAETLLDGSPEPERRSEPDRKAQPDSQVVAYKSLRTVRSAATRFSRLVDRLSGSTWTTLAMLSVLAAYASGYGYPPPYPTAPYEGVKTFNDLLWILGAVFIPPRIAWLRQLGPRSKVVLAVIVAYCGLIPHDFFMQGHAPFPQLISYSLNFAASVPNMIKEIVDGIIRLVILVTILVVVLLYFGGGSVLTGAASAAANLPRDRLGRWTKRS